MCKNKVLIFDIGESMIFLFLLVPFLENKLISTNFQNEHDVCVLMITALLESEGVKSPLKDEIINNVKSNKGRERLVGRSNDIFYGLTFRKVNSENKILVSSALDDVKVVSLSDCLRNYVLNEVFFENKLNVGNIAREALGKAFKESLVSGKIKYEINKSVSKNDIFLGLTIANKKNMEAQIVTSGDKEVYFRCYRHLIHRESSALILEEKWQKALELLSNLTVNKIGNHNTWFGVGKCMSKIGDKKGAVVALENSFNLAIKNKPELKSSWYFYLGKEAVDLGEEGGQLAQKALIKSIELFFIENNSFNLYKIP